MDQLRDLADNRLLHGCIYCDVGAEETRDHVPSRVLLDRPYPENLPKVPACFDCNNGVSRDEEYLAALIECVRAGSTEPADLERQNVADILRRSPALRARIESGRNIVDGRSHFTVEDSRIVNVVCKLATGHAAYELSSPFRRPPTSVVWKLLWLLTPEEREAFEAPHHVQLLGEVGSRGSQRELVVQLALKSPTGAPATLNMLINDWIEVQEGRYRYLVIDGDRGAAVRIVIAEFLACEVLWRDEV